MTANITITCQLAHETDKAWGLFDGVSLVRIAGVVKAAAPGLGAAPLAHAAECAAQARPGRSERSEREAT